MGTVKVDTRALLKWIGSDEEKIYEREAFLREEAKISTTTLKNIKNFYQPGERVAILINQVIERYPAGTPLPNRKVAVG